MKIKKLFSWYQPMRKICQNASNPQREIENMVTNA